MIEYHPIVSKYVYDHNQIKLLLVNILQFSYWMFVPIPQIQECDIHKVFHYKFLVTYVL